MDSIIIRGLRVFAHHGVLSEEKENGQDFFLDLELFLDLSEACESDVLDKTINYDEVCRIAAEQMEEGSCDLIEHAAELVCRRLFDEFELLERVGLTLRKPYAPLCRVVEYAAVHIERTRRS